MCVLENVNVDLDGGYLDQYLPHPHQNMFLPKRKITKRLPTATFIHYYSPMYDVSVIRVDVKFTTGQLH